MRGLDVVMPFKHVAPPSPQLDAMMDPSSAAELAGNNRSPRRSFRARMSDTLHRARGRSTSPVPTSPHTSESPSPTKSLGKLFRKSMDFARSASPTPTPTSHRNSDVVYSYTAPEYEVPDLPDWQLYDGTSVPMDLVGMGNSKEVYELPSESPKPPSPMLPMQPEHVAAHMHFQPGQVVPTSVISPMTSRATPTATVPAHDFGAPGTGGAIEAAYTEQYEAQYASIDAAPYDAQYVTEDVSHGALYDAYAQPPSTHFKEPVEDEMPPPVPPHDVHLEAHAMPAQAEKPSWVPQGEDAPLFGHTAPRTRSGRVSLGMAPTSNMAPVPPPTQPVAPVSASTTQGDISDWQDGRAEVDIVNAYADTTVGATETGNNTVIEHDVPTERTNRYEPTVPNDGTAWRTYDTDASEYEDDDNDVDVSEQGLVARNGATPATTASETERAMSPGDKQQRILDAMQKAPEGAGLTDLMNRVVKPERQSWLKGLWTRQVSGASQAPSSRSVSQSQDGEGVIFRGADVSPSIYSNQSMERFDDQASLADEPVTGLVDSEARELPEQGLVRGTASRASTQLSDDEREAFERRRASHMQARQILEEERERGMSGDFREQVLGPTTSTATPMLSVDLPLPPLPSSTAPSSPRDAATPSPVPAAASPAVEPSSVPAAASPAVAPSPVPAAASPAVAPSPVPAAASPAVAPSPVPAAASPAVAPSPVPAAASPAVAPSPVPAAASPAVAPSPVPAAASPAVAAPTEPRAPTPADWAAEQQQMTYQGSYEMPDGQAYYDGQQAFYYEGHAAYYNDQHQDAYNAYEGQYNAWQAQYQEAWPAMEQGYEGAASTMPSADSTSWHPHHVYLQANTEPMPDISYHGNHQWEAPKEGWHHPDGPWQREQASASNTSPVHQVRRKALPGSQPAPPAVAPTMSASVSTPTEPLEPILKPTTPSVSAATMPVKSSIPPILPPVDESDSSIIMEDGRKYKSDGFGGLVLVNDEAGNRSEASATPDVDERATTPVPSTEVVMTPKAPQVQSMRTDFHPEDGRAPTALSVHMPLGANGGKVEESRLTPSPQPGSQGIVRAGTMITRPTSGLARSPSLARAATLSHTRSLPADGRASHFHIAPEVYTTPQSLQGSVGRMTWTPEMAEAAAKYIQSMTSSASHSSMQPFSAAQVPAVPVPGAPEPLPLPKDTAPTPTVPQPAEPLMPTSRSVMAQLEAKGMHVDVMLDAGEGAGVDDNTPLREAIKELMLRFYFYERHSIPILRELDHRLVALEHWSLLDPDAMDVQPAWNKDAVARVTSEVRREVRSLMMGAKMLNECRLHVQKIATTVPEEAKRKRPSSVRGPNKRLLSSSTQASSSRVSSVSSVQSTGTVIALPTSEEPVAPSTPSSMHRRRLPTPQGPPALATLMTSSSPIVPGSPMMQEALALAQASSSPGATPTLPSTPRALPTPPMQAVEMLVEAPVDMPVDGPAEEASTETPAETPVEEPAKKPTEEPVDENDFRAPTPVKPVVRARSSLLASLQRADMRARTPPPPSSHGNEAESENSVPTGQLEKDQVRASTPRAPFASVGNTMTTTNKNASTGLRARAQKYLDNVEKVSASPSKDSVSTPENVAPTRSHAYQPSALSESLRRRMARFEAARS